MRLRKKILGIMVAVLMVFGMLPSITVVGASSGTTIDMSDLSPPASGDGWTFDNNVYTITGTHVVTITGDNGGSQRRVAVGVGVTATVILDGVSITGLAVNQEGFLLNNGATLTMNIASGTTNTFHGNNLRAAIQAPAGTTLIIDSGAGSTLVAQGVWLV